MWMHSESVLEVDNLSKVYSRKPSSTRKRLLGIFLRILLFRSLQPVRALNEGEFWSLKNISFSVNKGEALGIIGLNGAGKTTLLRLLAGQILPDGGELRLCGYLASMIDLTAGFQMSSSGKRNIHLRSAMLGRSNSDIQESYNEIVEFSELGDAIEAPVSTYSSGMLMRLAFSIMISVRPDILLVDEILSVGDFQFRQKCLSIIREIRNESAIVLVSHSMDSIRSFCDTVIVLDRGRIVYMGEPPEAIKIYEQMKYPKTTNLESVRREVLKPQFHNKKIVSNVKHYWCDELGRPVSEVTAGETLFLVVSFKISYTPRKLIMGVPVWHESGTYVTGFSTELQDKTFSVVSDQMNNFILKVTDLALNPGEYMSNFAIHDGVECLYRKSNNAIKVISKGRRCWGVVTLKHDWEVVSETSINNSYDV